MKNRLYNVLPWSYRSHVAVFLILLTAMSGMSSMLLSSLINREMLSREMQQSESELAVTLLQLDEKTGLTTEELLGILERSNLEAVFVSKEELSAMEHAEGLMAMLEDNPMAFFGSTRGMPSMVVRTSSGYVLITAAMEYNVYSSIWTRVMSVSLFFMAFFLLASLYGSKRITSPVSDLTEATRRISEGDFTVRVPEHEHGEIGDLMRSFNKMTTALGRTSFAQKDFISSVSHEFKTPIASIKGYARLLSMPGLEESEREEYIRMISSESDRLSRLSDTMLRLTALDQQEYSAARDSFSLDEQVRQVIVRMQTAWQNKKIDWDLDLVEVHVVSDSALLEQVWTNLIQNAVKFSESGSTVHIRVWSEKNRAMFRIRDHGIGMSEESLEHIFDRFYQEDRSRSGQGVGLGLSLVKRILDMLGGEIEVKSHKGEGSVFQVSIPRDQINDTKSGGENS